MKHFLQRFGFKESRYERPNQKWVCGALADGRPCPRGPDAQGNCGATSECAPLRKGDRWFCTRAAAAGGPCADGPKPDGTCCHPGTACAPVRSVRARRALTTQLTVAFTFGALLFLLGSSGRWHFLSPGPLTSSHSMSEAVCADCHGKSFSSGAPSASVSGGIAHTNLDSHRCLNCHQLGPQPLTPHGLPPTEQAVLTAKAEPSPSASRPATLALSAALFGNPGAPGRELACGTCHQEHRGKGHRLATLDNSQCQSCHQQQFKSFAAGHPDFTGYPYPRRTRIFFDHVSHLEKHFQDAQQRRHAPEFCTSCHQPDAAGRGMLVKNFATTCAQCHAGQIQGEGRADAPGIPVLRVPGLDARSLRERNRAIGDWPEQAEGRLTPFMQLLLASDATHTAAIAKLAKADWLDLLDAKPDELQAAETIAWAVKDLFFDLVTKGQAAWRERLQTTLGRELAPAEFARLVGQLPPDLLNAAQAEWFPNLLTEVPAHRAGEKPAAKPASPEPSRAAAAGAKPILPENWVTHGGWYRTRTDYTLLYRPAGHADPFLHAWLDLTASVPTNHPTPLPAVFKSLGAPQAPGLCTKCHSSDLRADQARMINWQPARSARNQHTFTKFSHGSHFSLLDQKGCLTCHQLNPTAEYQKAFENNFSPAVFASNFAPLPKAVCAECHTPSRAGDTCLKCHEYHIGTFTPTLSKQAQTQRMTAAPPAK